MGGRRAICCVLALATLFPGCRAVGELADHFYDGAVATFVPNPVAAWGFFSGYGIGFVAGLPFLLLSWPLTLLFYPDHEDAFRQQAILSPSHPTTPSPGATSRCRLPRLPPETNGVGRLIACSS